MFGPTFPQFILGQGEQLSYRTHRLIGRDALSPEFTEAYLSPDFRRNGNTMPESAAYQQHMETGFANWQLGQKQAKCMMWIEAVAL